MTLIHIWHNADKDIFIVYTPLDRMTFFIKHIKHPLSLFAYMYNTYIFNTFWKKKHPFIAIVWIEMKIAFFDRKSNRIVMFLLTSGH